jgi:hypothetical protein
MDQLSPQQRHRRDIITGITLPIVGGLLLMAVMFGLAIAFLNPVQFSIVANLLAILFILVPYVLICLVPTLILMAGALGLWAAQGRIAHPVRRGRRAVIGALASGARYAALVGQPVIAVQSRLAAWEYLLSRRRAPTATEEETTP